MKKTFRYMLKLVSVVFWFVVNSFFGVIAFGLYAFYTEEEASPSPDGYVEDGTDMYRYPCYISKDQSLQTTEQTLGLKFPADTKIIYADRYYYLALHKWFIFSYSPMKFPFADSFIDLTSDEAEGDDYKAPSKKDLDYLEKITGQTIPASKGVFVFDWNTNGFAFQGTLVRTLKGDYFYVDGALHK